MRLDTFLLADHAVAAADGKIYINGAGVTRLDTPGVPFVVPVLSVVLRFSVTPDDVGDHRIELQLTNPLGQELFPKGPSLITVQPPGTDRHPDEEMHAQAVFVLGGIPILAEGTHTLTVRLDGRTVKKFKLPVVVGNPPGQSGQ